jgi:hypothetical protein
MEFLEPLADGLDRFWQGGSSCSEPDEAHTAEPLGLQFFRAFDVQCSLARGATSFD